MENIEQMKKRHQEEIRLLQEGCKHLDVSDWMPYAWAPGHFSGQCVKVCYFCGKIVDDGSK